jgi:hypothetical protein
MARVKVDPGDSLRGVAEAGPDAEQPTEEAAEAHPPPASKRPRGPEVEVEREVTKRQLIQSITTVVVVILYMAFTLLRDREAGVVVVDPDDDGQDDWQEGGSLRGRGSCAGAALRTRAMRIWRASGPAPRLWASNGAPGRIRLRRRSPGSARSSRRAA